MINIPAQSGTDGGQLLHADRAVLREGEPYAVGQLLLGCMARAEGDHLITNRGPPQRDRIGTGIIILLHGSWYTNDVEQILINYVSYCI